MDAYYNGAHTATAADVKTSKFDARFPNTNQTKNCWQNYVDFHKCQKIKVCLSDGVPLFLSSFDWGSKDQQNHDRFNPTC